MLLRMKNLWDEFVILWNCYGPGYHCKFLRIGYWSIVMKRRTMSRSGSKAYFTATASQTHYKNVKPRPMRGGIRL